MKFILPPSAFILCQFVNITLPSHRLCLEKGKEGSQRGKVDLLARACRLRRSAPRGLWTFLPQTHQIGGVIRWFECFEFRHGIF